MTGGVDQVDEESVSNGLLGDHSDVLLGKLEVEGDGGRLDGDTSLLLVVSEEEKVEKTVRLDFSRAKKRRLQTHRVSMNRVSPALAEAMIPALATRESERVDFPWSTGAAKVDKQVRDGAMGRGEKSGGQKTHRGQ